MRFIPGGEGGRPGTARKRPIFSFDTVRVILAVFLYAYFGGCSMDWKQEAAEKLMQYEARRQALENIPMEIHRLELEYTGLRSSVPDAIPTHGGGSRREDAMLTNIVRREELARQLESARAWVALTDGALATLNEEDSLVLDKFFIHRRKGACEELCDQLYLEKAQIYRRRERALRRFTLALYGGLES